MGPLEESKEPPWRDRLVGLRALIFITTLLLIVAPCLQLPFSVQFNDCHFLQTKKK